jgi:type III restriction enzyme
MFALKGYQKRAMETLASFFRQAKQSGDIEQAYSDALVAQELPPMPYRDFQFGTVPYVCIRIPTGGGKTVLASHSIVTAGREYLQVDFPVVLWLVPSTTIRQQTVEALKQNGHPYREKLDQAFNHQVLVLDIDEVLNIRPQDIGSKTIVIVSTRQNLTVNDTSGRKVYAYHENFEPHFAKVDQNHPRFNELERVGESDLKENGLTTRELGKIKYSFANLLALHNPLVIIDEAHNARTKLTFDTLRRIHPAAIIEFTATPNESLDNGSNILFNVSAGELKAEEMIKLPIMLAEETQGWKQSVGDAVANRNRLAIEAQKDVDYIRPIALLQAEAKNGTVTVDVLKNFLLDELKIEPEKIAVVTGNQRELDNINLFATDCSIEYIITIEALKEGWDCPFAYVFCSVKQVSSSKDAEQLLGRVLRMPYARRRVIEDLNRAYAHLATTSFAKAATELKDKLIAMGFEELDIAEYVRQYERDDNHDDLFGDGTNPQPRLSKPMEIVVEVASMPELDKLNENERSQLTATTTEEGIVVVKVRGEVTENLKEVIVKSAGKPANRKSIEQDIRIHNARIEVARSPAEKGDKFGSLPQLCAVIQGELELVEPETLLDVNEWNLLDYPAKLSGFKSVESSNLWEIDIEGKKVTYGTAEPTGVYDLNQSWLDVTQNDLVRWLDRELRQADVPQGILIKFINMIVSDLISRPELTLTALVRNKYPLARTIKDLISRYRKKAQKEGYQQALFSTDAKLEMSSEFVYSFSPNHYPAKSPFYSGSYRFQKHYYGNNRIEDMKATGEEFECARAIDSLPQVKYWIRNLVRRDHGSFWLPLAHGKFYPDFIVELKDGRMFVVEYKGDAYATNDDSKEKNLVGELWAAHGGEKALFLMAVDKKTDPEGRDTRTQLLDVIEG